ncbi:MAG TPA: hypothetical protein VGS10_19295, partial [Terracidiphilus sp.]|nr:hypothetical protein [Terracidiphilus sp.]
MKSPVKSRTLRESFWIVLSFFGEFLLYLDFAAPFEVTRHLAVFSLMEPPQAQIFGTVMPYYTVLQLLGLVLGGSLFLLGPRRAIISNRAFMTYAAVNLIGIAALPFLTPTGHPVYWDFALEFLRLSSTVLLAGTVLEARDFNPFILLRCLLIVLVVPLIYLLATNPTEFLDARSGRVNGPGLEITSTGHVAALAVLLGIFLRLPGRYRVPLIALGTVMLLLSGARIPLVLAIMIIVVTLWQRTQGMGKRLALMTAVTAVILFVLMLAQSNLIAGGRVGSLTGNSSDLETEYAVGRGLAAVASWEMIAAHPLGYIDS